MHSSSKKFSRRARAALIVIAFSLAAPSVGRTHSTSENAYFDNFETVGPLPGRTATDPWETKTGTWTVVEDPNASVSGEINHVLLQNSRATTPNEPMTFVRALPFRETTVQVTAAFLDATTVGGDPTPNSSLGIVFRSPLTDDIADRDNLYLFAAQVSGVMAGFPTGKSLVLFKRVGRTYYIVRQKMVPMWTDVTKAHDYKVVMGGGRILCYFDGRLAIDYTDDMLGDEPVAEDEMPGLPYESGAVGLRTSSARAWFDNFRVVGNDAYEGRAGALDGNVQYGDASPNVRRGTSVQLAGDLRRAGLPGIDTEFVYHDHNDFDDAVIRSVDNPSGGDPSVGASVRTYGGEDSVTSVARLAGVQAEFIDPNGKIHVFVSARAITASATATCSDTASEVAISNGSVTIVVEDADPRGADIVVGPIPIGVTYDRNSVIQANTQPYTYSVVAHATTETTEPHRVDVTALKIVVGAAKEQGAPGAKATPPSAPFEIDLGNVVAGRYCSP